MPLISGIYEIRHTSSSRQYIGSSSHIAHRWACHRYQLRHGQHPNQKLQASWNKYGEHAFSFEVLEQVPQAQLLEAEQLWLDHKSPFFNISPIAGTRRGVKSPPGTGDKIRARLKGQKKPDGFGTKVTLALKGRKCPATSARMMGRQLSEETKAKIRTKAIGRVPSPESVARQVASLRAYYARKSD